MTELLQKLIPLNELKQTMQRFPLSAFCSIALFTLLLLNIHDLISLEGQGNAYTRLMALAACGFLWFVLARLIAEERAASAAFEYGFGLAVFALLALAVFGELNFSLTWMLGLMVPALLLGVAIGPYFWRSDNFSFWFYNRQLWQGVAIAIAAGVIWGVGLSAALEGIRYLFEVKIEGEIFGDIWSFALVVFAPLYALSRVPRRFIYTEDDCHAPPQLAFMLNWVLVPLAVVYMLILYAYFIKIAAVQELPRGQLSYMVSAFASLGVLTYMAGWPLRDTGAPLLRLVVRWFFPALLVPTLMQALAIYRRIEQYGITEQRYVVALSAIWFGVLAVLYTVKKPPLKIIPGLLAVLLLVAALGPVSAPKVAERSQMARLEMLLLSNGILVDGKIRKTEQAVSVADRRSISSILSFLQQRRKMDRIKPWLPETLAASKTYSPHSLTKEMGFDYIHRYAMRATSGPEIIHLGGTGNTNVLEVTGFDFLTPPQYLHCADQHCSAELPWHGEWQDPNAGLGTVAASYADGRLKVAAADRGELEFDLHAYIAAELDNDPGRAPRALMLEQNGTGFSVRVIIRNIAAVRGDKGDYRLHDIDFRLLLAYPEQD